MKLKTTQNGTLEFTSSDGEVSLIKEPKVRDGLCTIKNLTSGIEHCAHPNIDKTGSVAGMKKRGFWKQDAEILTKDGYRYNMSKNVCSDDIDRLCLSIEREPYLLTQIMDAVFADGQCDLSFASNGDITTTPKPIDYTWVNSETKETFEGDPRGHAMVHYNEEEDITSIFLGALGVVALAVSGEMNDAEADEYLKQHDWVAKPNYPAGAMQPIFGETVEDRNDSVKLKN